ncbi:PDR/VanB family oxidoreductase [Leifsonia kafniensis]|uniref:PDR/VanB family oxidoreductase n=1 Tax=Leifsonia kafniensis TaxID=475957 RepID=UPI0031F08A11
MDGVAEVPFTVPAIVEERVDRGSIAVLRLRRTDASPWPSWAPGDHVEIETGCGVRQYSLCGAADDPHWTIAVLREPEGRGGSDWLHHHALPGAELMVRGPRTTFPFGTAPEYLFVAGGIGITAIAPMVAQAERDGVPWRLIYSARERGAHLFRERYAVDPRVVLWASESRGRLDLADHLTGLGDEVAVYGCGPTAMLDELHRVAAVRHGLKLRTERFAGVATRDHDRTFSLELARSGRTIRVPAGISALDAASTAGVFIVSSCRSGYCGSCEVAVLSGVVDHRDSILDAAERAENSCMFPCVSRAVGDKVVIDL